jgi:hypothetical protein
MVNLKPMGMFPLIWYLPPKVKNEPPIVNVPEARLSATQVPEVNVAPVDGRLAEIAPAESMRRRNALDPFMLKENPITANESSGSGTSLNASALADAKTVETPAVAKFASSTPVVLSYRATVVLLGGGPIIPPPERLSANRRYMWAPMIFASFIRALRAKTPLLPKLPTRDPFASNFLIVDVLVIMSLTHTYRAPVESDRMDRPCTDSDPLVPKLVSTVPVVVTLNTEYVETIPFWPNVYVSTLTYTEPEGPAAMPAIICIEPEGGAGKDTVPPLPHVVSRAPVDVSRTKTGVCMLFANVDPLRMNDPLEPRVIELKLPETST